MMPSPFAAFGDRVRSDQIIAAYTTLKLPAIASYFCLLGGDASDSEDLLIRLVQTAHDAHMPIHILGGGSNVAYTHATVPGLTIVNRLSSLRVIDEDSQSVTITVSSGYPMNRLVQESCAAGWEGFEYHLGLPGTLGGAIYMNSKWMRPVAYVSDCLIEARILDVSGTVRTVNRDYFAFSYGWSNLQQTKEILLDATFRLMREDPHALTARAQESLTYRKETQPIGVLTAGCFFKNISEEERVQHHLPTTSAGYLIDHTGLKGVTMGHFSISHKHANFIIHEGGGSADELRILLKRIKRDVFKKFGVHLREEVCLIPEREHRSMG